MEFQREVRQSQSERRHEEDVRVYVLPEVRFGRAGLKDEVELRSIKRQSVEGCLFYEQRKRSLPLFSHTEKTPVLSCSFRKRHFLSHGSLICRLACILQYDNMFLHHKENRKQDDTDTHRIKDRNKRYRGIQCNVIHDVR